MPKVLPERFTTQDNCKECNRLRKQCHLCNKCSDHCKCKDIPNKVRFHLSRAMADLHVAIHKAAISFSGTGPDEITKEDVYDALSEVDFQGIFEKHFPPPPPEN
jgi:hypothetical protein